MSCSVGTDVPKLNGLVPRATVDLVWVDRVEFDSENFVLMSMRFTTTADDLDGLESLIIINFNLGQQTSNC